MPPGGAAGSERAAAEWGRGRKGVGAKGSSLDLVKGSSLDLVKGSSLDLTRCCSGSLIGSQDGTGAAADVIQKRLQLGCEGRCHVLAAPGSRQLREW